MRLKIQCDEESWKILGFVVEVNNIEVAVKPAAWALFGLSC